MYVVDILLLFFFPLETLATESTCFGATGNGRLEHGIKLPGSGRNFQSYGLIPGLAGRTYVHSKVRDTVVDAYATLEKEMPGKVFKYAETRKRGQVLPRAFSIILFTIRLILE